MRDDESNEPGCEELARKAKGGDREARDRLYGMCGHRIGRLAAEARRLLSRVPPGAGGITREDIAQQSFVAFCDLLERWDPAATPFIPYLTVNMRWKLSHYARSELKHHEHRQRPPTEPRDESQAPVGEPPSPEAEQAILHLESRVAFEQDSAVLKDQRLKRVIALRYVEGLTKGQIAALEDISPRTVNRKLSQAREALRSLLENEEECG